MGHPYSYDIVCSDCDQPCEPNEDLTGLCDECCGRVKCPRCEEMTHPEQIEDEGMCVRCVLQVAASPFAP
jgi:hypothetical protein